MKPDTAPHEMHDTNERIARARRRCWFRRREVDLRAGRVDTESTTRNVPFEVARHAPTFGRFGDEDVKLE